MRFALMFVFIGMAALLLGTHAWAHPITVDGNASDWVGVPGGVDTWVYNAGEGIWHDAVGDDNGDGGDAPLAPDNPSAYMYPTDTTFHGFEADIREFRVTADQAANKLYFLIRVNYATVWVPLIGICADIDHIPGSGQSDCGAYGEVNVSPENEWEYLIVARNSAIAVLDSAWGNVPSGTNENYFLVDTLDGLIELGIDVSNWSPSPWGKTLYFTVYGALNSFDNCRDVDSVAGQWTGGGGMSAGPDPKVYDLCFVSAAEQPNDLNQYSSTTRATIRTTTVQGVNMDLVPVERNTWGG